MAKLKPRARIIRTIGDQLISGPEAAIIELVKNSYDAESSYSDIKFEYDAKNGFSIKVSDDGHGMTYDEILNNWLEPATDVKAKLQWSRNKTRRLLGAKGIGRFAVSRLGEISLMNSIAKNKSSLQASSILIDWSIFTAEKYLEDIDLDIVEVEVTTDSQTGVEIEVTQLRDIWSEKQIERLTVELRRLSNTRNDDDFAIYLDLACFTKENSGFDGISVFEEQNQGLQITDDKSDTSDKLIKPYVMGDIADYRLDGLFKEDGSFEGTFQIQRGDRAMQNIKLPPTSYKEDEKNCGNIKLILNIYDREPEAVSNSFERMGLNFDKIGLRKARKILSDISGVSIVRNDFRIRPYGDPDYDWLSLQGRRVQDPSKRLGLDQVSGFLEITDESRSGVIERSSREGLEVNSQFRRLKSLIVNLLPHIEERRYEFREKAGIGRKTTTNVDRTREVSKLKRVTNALNLVPKEHQAAISKAIEEDTAAINLMLDEVDDYQKILQSRSALGLVVAEVIHEGRRQLDPMLTSTKTLKADIQYAFDKSEIGELYRENFPHEVDTIMSGGKALSRLFKSLDPISGRKRGKPADFKLLDVYKDTMSIMSHAAEANSINIEGNLSSDVYCYGYREDLHAVFLNVIENAIYWLASVEDQPRIIWIHSRETKTKILIQISNNGPEIDEAYVSRLFEAGFSLKSDGTGLGLAIAREASRASKGDLKIDTDNEDTTFMIEFPKGRAK